MHLLNDNFTIKNWIKEENESSSNSWIWKQLTKHLAYGKGIPIQLGDFNALEKLHVQMRVFLKQKEKAPSIDDKNKDNFKKINKFFSTKEDLDSFVTKLFTNWEELLFKFAEFYNSELSKEKNTTTKDFVETFIALNQDISNQFKDNLGEENIDFYTDLKKLFNHLEQQVWKSNSYYSSPLFTSFGYYAPWRWFYLLWVYYRIIIIKESFENDKWRFFSFGPNMHFEHGSDDSPGINHFEKSSITDEEIIFPLPYCHGGCLLKKEDINDEKIFFICGPVFSPPQQTYFHDRTTYLLKIKPTLILFKIFQKLLNSRTKKKFSKSLTEADVFLKACGTKPYFYSKTLKKSMKNVSMLFDTMLETKLSNHQQFIKRSSKHTLVLVSLLRWAVFVNKTIETRKFYFLRPKFPFNKTLSKILKPIEIYLSIGLNSYLIKTKIKDNKVDSLEFTQIEESIKEACLESDNGIILVKRNHGIYYKPVSLEILNWIEVEYIKFNSNFDIRTRTSKQPYLLAAWLRRHFHLQTKSNKEEFNKKHKPICRNICDLFDADAAVIYTYHHSEKQLKLITSWFANKEDKKHEQKLAQMMLNLSDEEKLDSICYRSVDLNTVQFTLAFDPDNEIASHKGYKLCCLKELQIRSAIAVPLLFKGRVLGVIEIAGKKEFQFGWTNREILNQTSIVLSTAFYQQRLVNALHKINITALNLKTENEIESYGQICKYIASIFLCDGASLWYKSEKDRNRYQCLGAYNHHFIIQQLKADPSAVIYTADDKYSMEAKELLLDGKLSTPTYEIGVEPLGKEWLKSALFRYKLKEQNIRFYTSFSIRDEKDEFSGSLSLYDKTTIGFEDWDSMYLFISNFISVILEAVNVFAIEHKFIQAKKDHEIAGSAKAVLDKLERFFYLSQPIFSMEDRLNLNDLDFSSVDVCNLSELKRKLDLVKYDLESLKNRIRGLSQDDKKTQVTPMNIEKLSVNKQFKLARSIHFKMLNKKSIDCQLVISGSENLFFLIDKNELQAILSNLISNAAKYSLENEQINVLLKKETTGWSFFIQNKGAPLREGEEERLFQDGFRSEYAIQNGIEGAGMGLSIIRDTCDHYGIEVYYESKSIPDHSEVVLHSFILEIPDKMILDNHKGITE